MTQEEKNLVLKDLCGRLPYGVKCVSGVDDATLIIEGINPNCCGASEVQVTYERSGINFDTTLSAIKPYLFPISSMTEEQKVDFDKMSELDIEYTITQIKNDSLLWTSGLSRFNWFLKNHFDVYGLIPKDLALDATGLNIY